MATSNVELSSANVIARPAAPVATAPGFSRATLTGALAAPMSTEEHAQARSGLILAQYQQTRPGQAVRPIPVPPNRGGYVTQPGYVATPNYGYVQPGYAYPQQSTGFSFGLSTGPNGTSLWAGNGVQPYYQQQQTYAQDVIVANATGQQYYLKAGYPMPVGYYVVNTNPGFWAWLTTPNLY